MEKRSRRGISPRVLRVTFRSDDTLIGYMRGYFNVPDVFGSGGSGRTHQTALYQGADGADVITAAVREAGGRIAFTSVLGFRRYAVDQDRHRLHRRTRPRQARGHPGPGVHQADPAQALHHPGDEASRPAAWKEGEMGGVSSPLTTISGLLTVLPAGNHQ